MNERLARHYGIPGVKGSGVPPRGDRPAPTRGGVLTQASVLTVSSYATRTSPVLRGKWILENVLNAPPPDPPAGTPRLDEAKVGADASLRKQLEAHRTNATCAACHEKMDPLGFSLENFDAIGTWRKEDGKWPVDASGVLPDGRGFAGPGGPADDRAAPGPGRPSRRMRHREDADVRARTGPGALRPAEGQGDRREPRARATIASRRWCSEIVRSLPFQRAAGGDGVVNFVIAEAPVAAHRPARPRRE